MEKPCQLLKSTRKEKKLCTKIDEFLLMAQAFVTYGALRQVQWYNSAVCKLIALSLFFSFYQTGSVLLQF